jgi:hypothetical protein
VNLKIDYRCSNIVQFCVMYSHSLWCKWLLAYYVAVFRMCVMLCSICLSSDGGTVTL